VHGARSAFQNQLGRRGVGPGRALSHGRLTDRSIEGFGRGSRDGPICVTGSYAAYTVHNSGLRSTHVTALPTGNGRHAQHSRSVTHPPIAFTRGRSTTHIAVDRPRVGNVFDSNRRGCAPHAGALGSTQPLNKRARGFQPPARSAASPSAKGRRCHLEAVSELQVCGWRRRIERGKNAGSRNRRAYCGDRGRRHAKNPPPPDVRLGF
jgi:hypothetical protein